MESHLCDVRTGAWSPPDGTKGRTRDDVRHGQPIRIGRAEIKAEPHGETRLAAGGCRSLVDKCANNLDNGIDRSLDSYVAGARRPVYVISIAAGLAGCHPRTLRIYEEEGLLDPVRTDTNIRLYSDEDLERVRAIRYLTQTRGVNLAGVKLLLQLRDAADFLDEIAEQLARDDAEVETPQPLEVTNEAPSRKPRTRQRHKGVEL